eukprot:gene12264-biopygen10348
MSSVVGAPNAAFFVDGIYVSDNISSYQLDNLERVEVFKGPKQWQAIGVDSDAATYRWSEGSTYVKNPPYFEGITMEPSAKGDIKGARILAELGDSIT